MREILLSFAQSGGLLAVLLLLFVVGFALKVMTGLCYDSALECMRCVKGTDAGIVSDIINSYRMNLKEGKKIKNTQAYVENELHRWKKCGLYIERLESIGDIFGGICLMVCIFFDMLMLTQKTMGGNDASDIMRYVYVYTALTIIFFIVIKMWNVVANIINKRKMLTDSLVNYIDNRLENIPEYVKLNNKQKESPGFFETENEDGALAGDMRAGVTEEKKYCGEIKDDMVESNLENSMQIETKSVLKRKNKILVKSAEKEDAEDKELVITQILDEFLV